MVFLTDFYNIFFQSGDGDDKPTSPIGAAKSGRTSSPFSPMSIVLSLIVVALGVAFSYFYSHGRGLDEDDLEDLPPMAGEKRIPRREDEF